jgi:hypothetical protein
MNLVSATKKITNCINSATTKEHHQSIQKMIANVENYCKIMCPWDKSIKGALVLLNWQNINKCQNKFGG